MAARAVASGAPVRCSAAHGSPGIGLLERGGDVCTQACGALGAVLADQLSAYQTRDLPYRLPISRSRSSDRTKLGPGPPTDNLRTQQASYEIPLSDPRSRSSGPAGLCVLGGCVASAERSPYL